MPNRFAAALVAVLALVCASCVPAFAQTGGASWYGPGFHGRKTASGERFDQNAMTCAHRTARFGTKLRVTDTRTGKSIVCRVNDRGPFIRGRVVDLSKAAAARLGILSRGIGTVTLQRLN